LLLGFDLDQITVVHQFADQGIDLAVISELLMKFRRSISRCAPVERETITARRVESKQWCDNETQLRNCHGVAYFPLAE
jgi:hypothetical protein